MKQKLVGISVIIQGDDKDKLEVLFTKILNGSIELNELKVLAAYLGSVCKAADLSK